MPRRRRRRQAGRPAGRRRWRREQDNHRRKAGRQESKVSNTIKRGWAVPPCWCCSPCGLARPLFRRQEVFKQRLAAMSPEERKQYAMGLMAALRGERVASNTDGQPKIQRKVSHSFCFIPFFLTLVSYPCIIPMFLTLAACPCYIPMLLTSATYQQWAVGGRVLVRTPIASSTRRWRAAGSRTATRTRVRKRWDGVGQCSPPSAGIPWGCPAWVARLVFHRPHFFHTAGRHLPAGGERGGGKRLLRRRQGWAD